jgi:hypothetical protein
MKTPSSQLYFLGLFCFIAQLAFAFSFLINETWPGIFKNSQQIFKLVPIFGSLALVFYALSCFSLVIEKEVLKNTYDLFNEMAARFQKRREE